MAKSFKLNLINKPVIAAIIALSFFGQAATPPQQIILETAYVVPVKPLETGLKSETVGRFVPTSLVPGDKEQAIGTKMIDYTANNFIQGEYFKNTQLGKVAEKIEKTMKAEVTFGGSEAGSVTHNINMQVLAFEHRAQLKYDGLVHMNLNYSAAVNSLDVTLSQPLGKTNLSVGHNTLAQQSRIDLQWAW